MKRIQLFSVMVLSGTFTLMQSCSGGESSSTAAAQDSTAKPPKETGPSLAGKVFVNYMSFDSAACTPQPNPGKGQQVFYFYNDSSFVRMITMCCGAPGEDFQAAHYYSGTCLYTGGKLELSYNPERYLYYTKLGKKSTPEKPVVESARAEGEMLKQQPLLLAHKSCNGKMYLELDLKAAKEYIVEESSMTGAAVQSELESRGVWGPLTK